MSRRVSIVYNPISGKNRGESAARETARILERNGFGECSLFESQGDDHLEQLGERASLDSDVIVAVGGDGTLNRVVNGMRNRTVPVGLVPCGTGNAVAQEFRVGRTPAEAARTITNGHIRTIDAIRVGGVLSLMMVGAGIEGDVDARMHKRRDGHYMSIWSYLPMFVSSLVRWRAPRMDIYVDGRLVADWADEVIVANIAHHGGPFTVAPGAKPDDGLLDVWVFQCGRPDAIVRMLLAVMFRMHRDSRCVKRYSARRVTIDSPGPVPYHVDGDPGGVTPLEATIEPKAFRLFARR